MSATYKLQYWPFRGLADVCRLILVKAQVEWEDAEVTGKDWGALKEGMPYGQIPVLTEFVNGKQVFRLAQSKSIERYLARKYNLMGDNEHENAFLDSVLEALVDHETKWRDAKWAWKENNTMRCTEEERQVLAKEFVEQVVPSLRFLERALEENGRNGHFVRDKLTYVDLHAFFIIEDMIVVSKDAAAEKALAGAPGLMKVYETVKADRVVGPYLTSEKRRPLQKGFC
ncbi:hypothetical protein HK101_008776 [Irineochytrium annulatum]|nr:hypothetical protein HK101_008776 [Irineochytrium annulatum]